MGSSVPRLSWILITYETYFYFFFSLNHLTRLFLPTYSPGTCCKGLFPLPVSTTFSCSLSPLLLLCFLCILYCCLLLTPYTFMYEKRVFNELHSLGPSFCLSDVLWTHVSPEHSPLQDPPYWSLIPTVQTFSYSQVGYWKEISLVEIVTLQLVIEGESIFKCI